MKSFSCVTSLIIFLIKIGVALSSYKNVKLSCSDGLMNVQVTTADDFYGVIYTRGSFQKTGCSYDADGGTRFRLDFPLEQCKTKWEDGVYTNVVVLQHDKDLITGGDSAFEIKCQYKSDGKSLEYTEAETKDNIVVRSEIKLKDADPTVNELPADQQIFVGDDNDTVILDPDTFHMAEQSKIRTEEL